MSKVGLSLTADRLQRDLPRLEYLEWLTRAQEGEIQANLRFIATLKEKVERLEVESRTVQQVAQHHAGRVRELETVVNQVTKDRDELLNHVETLCKEIDRYVMVESTMDKLREVRDQARGVL